MELVDFNPIGSCPTFVHTPFHDITHCPENICKVTFENLKDLNIISNIPIILCVSTDQNIQQSVDRSGGKLGNKGADSAEAALKMIMINSK